MKIVRINWIVSGIVALLTAGSLWHYDMKLSEAERDATIWAEVLVALHETNTGLISVKSGTTTIRYANTDACNIFGYEQPMGGIDINDILPEWFREAHQKLMLNSMDAATHGTLQKKNSTMPCTALRKDGTTVEVIVRVVIAKKHVIAIINLADEMNYSPMKPMPVIPPP